MDIEFVKNLWSLRFEKLKQSEAHFAWAYQEVLDDCLVHFGEKDATVPLLRQLVREERMHEKLVDEMIKMTRHTHPEYGVQ